VFTDYHWNEETDNPRLAYESNFNRRDGNQMLELLNTYSSNWNDEKSSNFFCNLEKVVRQLVPSRMKTVSDVISWIEKHSPRL
jgi:hypothetical protein